MRASSSRLGLLLLLLVVSPSRRLAAQLNLGVHNVGVSFGNSREWTGIRFNFQDQDVERVSGLNVTLWTPGKDGYGARKVEGIALGVSPASETMRGVSVGIAAVVTKREMIGIQAATAVVSNGNIDGVTLGLLATVSNGNMRGINVGGLATVANGGIDGVGVGGLAVVSNGRARWVTGSLLAVVANGGIDGVSASGLATVSDGPVRGFAFSGLATVGSDLQGITISGLAAVGSRSITGLAATIGRTDTRELRGVAIGAYNRVRGEQRGVTIGIYNRSRELHGLQLGVLNHAENARGIFRWLPIANFHR
jgi:hypothetical protein